MSTDPSPRTGAASEEKPAPETETTRTREPIDDLVSTAHSLKVGRRTLKYTATTGRVVLREEKLKDGVFTGVEARAEMFLTAYVADVPDPATRPVTFAFNGGPGSSSVWLHLGLLGPRLVDAGDAGRPVVPPASLIDNPDSLLAVSDLVFIDPVSTGYSRSVEGAKPGDFHGFEPDIASVGELIRLWTSRNGRWLSPKFVAGESYGTVRAAALADHLQTRFGMYLNGLILISSVIDFATVDFEYRNDRAYVDYLPTYAATAHYHGRHGRKALRTVLDEAVEYAERDYPWALSRGNRLTAQERAEHVRRLAALTGVSERYVEQSNLRLEHVRYFTELLRDEGLATGRLDSRFTAPLAHGTAESWERDPSMDAISGPYSAAWNHYVREELGYSSDLAYEQIAPTVNRDWSFKEFEGKPIDVSRQLADAIRSNPALQVHVGYGYYDGATPYYAAEDALAHLDLPEQLLGNIEHAYYEAGHMMYVHRPSRLQQSKDLATFVTRSSARS